MINEKIEIQKKIDAIDVLLEHWDDYSEKLELNMSTDDFVSSRIYPCKDEIKLLNFSLTPNGAVFNNDSPSVLNHMITKLYNNRKNQKIKMLEWEQKVVDLQNENNPNQDEINKAKNNQSKYKVLQMAQKVTLNSLYGSMGNEYSRIYSLNMAEGITLMGQLAIRWVSERVNTEINKILKTDNFDFIIAGDTDSFYFTLKPLVEKHFPDKSIDEKVDLLDKFAEKYIQPIIHKAYDELKDYMNSYEQKMNMSREVIASRGFWRAKKNYALLIHNSEGVSYATPKMKIMGLESVRSSTPELCRNAIENTVKLVLTADEMKLQSYVEQFEIEFKKSDIIDISFPRGVSDIKKWDNDGQIDFLSRTPIHVKGALTYNRLLDVNELKMTPIRNGNKIKFIYLKIPNPAHCNVISYPDYLPDELGLNEYIDYNTQYIKTYYNPIDSICECIGWNIKKRNTLF